jgi:hypothetical protein
VQIVLTAPRSLAELEENLQILNLPPMSDPECAAWERYGDLFYAGGADAFETRWP